MTDRELLAAIEEVRGMMIDVSTGSYPQIPELEPRYKELVAAIGQELRRRGIADPNPHVSLRRWYDRWSRGDLPKYRDRRVHINNLYDPLMKHIESNSPAGASLPLEPTGWARVDRGIEKIRAATDIAGEEEDFQAVGLRCREVLISLAQAVYNPELHHSRDGIEPSETDAKRMLESFFDAELRGGSNEQARRHAKASLDLANALQHRRTATLRDAQLCAEATFSVTRIVAIIANKDSSTD